MLVYRNIWEALKKEREDLDAVLVGEQGHWPEAAFLRQKSGYGPIVIMAVLRSLDDSHRFKHSGQVASYAGLVPTSCDSGDSPKRGGIRHQGRSMLMICKNGLVGWSSNVVPWWRPWLWRVG